MGIKEFGEWLNLRLDKIKQVLAWKQGEYATIDDRHHNFIQAAQIRRESVPECIHGLFIKHEVAVIDKIKSGEIPSKEFTDEKIGDWINYLLLLDAYWESERNKLPTIT